jgi:hypothetical protein
VGGELKSSVGLPTSTQYVQNSAGAIADIAADAFLSLNGCRFFQFSHFMENWKLSE